MNIKKDLWPKAPMVCLNKNFPIMLSSIFFYTCLYVIWMSLCYMSVCLCMCVCCTSVSTCVCKCAPPTSCLITLSFIWWLVMSGSVLWFLVFLAWVLVLLRWLELLLELDLRSLTPDLWGCFISHWWSFVWLILLKI